MKVCSSCQRCYDDPSAACSEADHPALSETRPGNTDMIAGYRLESLVDFSGRCDTYQAVTRSGQSCFIKILAAEDEGLEEFQNEARSAAAFFHPSVAETYETGTLANGDAYIVTEKPGGQTLRELLNNVGVPSLLTSIQVARQAAEALYALHQHGLIHGAVNPENIILTSDAEQRLLVKIRNIDLGAARTRSIVSNKFPSASELNSLRYFAPELSAGEAPSAQSDVYGVGVVFYEMLAGIPPFDAPTAAGLIDQHRNHQPAEIRIDKFDLRMLLSHTLKESLQKQPKLRHPTANTLARQLRHIEQLATHISTPPPAGAVLSAPTRPRAAPVRASAANVPTATPAANGPAMIKTKIDLPAAVTFEPGPAAVMTRTEPFAAKPAPQPEPVRAESAPEPVRAEPAPEPVRVEPIPEPVRMEPKPEPIIFESEPVVVYVEPQVIDQIEEAKPAVVPVPVEMPDISEALPKQERATTEISAAPVPEISMPLRRIPRNWPIAEVPKRVEAAAAPSAAPEISAVKAVEMKIEWEQAEDDIPSEVEVREIQLQELQTAPDPDQPAEQDDPIDLTPSAIPSPAITAEVEYVPFAAVVPEKKITTGKGDTLFSSYEVRPPSRIKVDYRTFVVGGGFVALVAIFLAGSAVLSESAMTDGSVSTLTAKLPVTEKPILGESPSEAGQAVPEMAVQDPETDAIAEDLRPEQLRPLTESEPERRSAEPVRARAEAAKVPITTTKPPATTPKPPAMPRAAPAPKVEKMPEIRSTIVISPRSSRTLPRIQLIPRAAEEKGKVPMTRPRIVRNPRP